MLDSASRSRIFFEQFVDPSKKVIIVLPVGVYLDVLGPEDEASLERIEMITIALTPDELSEVRHHLTRRWNVLGLIDAVSETAEHYVHR